MLARLEVDHEQSKMGVKWHSLDIVGSIIVTHIASSRPVGRAGAFDYGVSAKGSHGRHGGPCGWDAPL